MGVICSKVLGLRHTATLDWIGIFKFYQKLNIIGGAGMSDGKCTRNMAICCWFREWKCLRASPVLLPTTECLSNA